MRPLLPPSTQLQGLVAARRESLVPEGWPGTYVPNFSDWHVGDIVLVQRTPNTIGLAIEMAQATSRNAFTRIGRGFAHAALYVGDGLVVDATVGAGVSCQSVWNYCQYRELQLRRFTDPSIPQTDIADIAVRARAHVGEPYSVLAAIISKLIPGTVPAPNALYCSTFVGLVVAEATGIDLSYSPAFQPLHPGTLAAHPDLTNVMVEWRHL